VGEVLTKGYDYRALVLEDVKGETVFIGVGGLPSNFDELLPEAQKVLDILKWVKPGSALSVNTEQA
jgi:hypothetical protein